MIQEFLRHLSPKFNASTYDLMNNNCNNFSDVLCEYLVGKGVPVRPSIFCHIPLVPALAPTEFCTSCTLMAAADHCIFSS